uniref:AAA family ATPase n=1 Tax=Streptomyces sp. NBC_00180 TaxID=2903632 RepID=A0AAU1IDT2_9ACTN
MHRLEPQSFSAARGVGVFMGRGEELEWLAGSAERARARGPVAVCVEGEAGIGKSALLNRFLCVLDGFTVLRAVCDPSESDLPFGVVAQLAVRAPRARLNRYPLIAKLAAAPTARPALSLAAVGVQLRLLVDELLDAGPLAVAVDDLQWADWSSSRALRVALGQRGGEPLLVLATVPGDPGTEPGIGPVPQLVEDVGEQPTRLRLRGLDVSSVAALASLRTGAAWSRREVEELCLRTEGHPLYLQMVLADAHGPGGPFQAPGSLVAFMRSILDGLDVESRSVVDALAVLNAFVPPCTAAAVAGIDDPVRALRRPLQVGLVRWQGPGSALVGMAHELQREAVVMALTPARRRELHLAAVSVVDGPAKWAHRVAAAQQSDARSIAAGLEEAAWERIAGGDTDQAATWLLWAADLADKTAERERRVLTAVVQLLSGRRMDRVQPLLEAVRGYAPSPLKDCALGVAAGCQGIYPVARERLTAAIEAAAQAPGLEWVAAEAGNLLAALSCWNGLADVAMHHAREVLAVGGDVPRLVAPARSSMLIAHLLTRGPEAALTHVSTGVEPWAAPSPTAQNVGRKTPADGYWHACRALAHIAAAQPTASERQARLALSQPPTAASEAWSGDLAYFCLSMGQYQRGAWDESAVNAEHCISIAEGLEHPWARARAHTAASLTAAGRGEFDQAREHVEAARQWVHQVGPPQFEVYPAIARAVLAQAQQDHEAMAAALRPLQADPGGWIQAYRSWWLPLLAEALLATRHLHEAADAVRDLREPAQRTPNLAPVEAWLSGQLLECHGDLDAAADAYTTGLTLPKTPDHSPLNHARLEQAHGRLLAARGNDDAAIRCLQHAHHTYKALGATPFRNRCHNELIRLIRPAEFPDNP